MTIITNETDLLTDIEAVLANDQTEVLYRVKNTNELLLYIILDYNIRRVNHIDIDSMLVDKKNVEESLYVELSTSDIKKHVNNLENMFLEYDNSDYK